MILSISLQNKEHLFLWHFHIPSFVFKAPNLIYFHNLDMNKVGIVNGTSVLLHLSHISTTTKSLFLEDVAIGVP